MKTPED